MIRILLVDDDEDFRGSIKRALPRYVVDDVGTFGEAVSRLRANVPYDVAIVDLNLTKDMSARLGEDLLNLLKEEYPLIIRIALTADTPSSTHVFNERFGLADLLLKHRMELRAVRDAVGLALKRANPEMPPRLRSDRGDLWVQLRDWRDDRTQPFKERAERLENDVRDLGLASVEGKAAADELGGLRAGRVAFEEDCSAVAVTLTKVRNEADLATATAELLKLKESYEDLP